MTTNSTTNQNDRVEAGTPRTGGVFKLLEICWHPETDYEHFSAAREGARIAVEDMELDLAASRARIEALEKERDGARAEMVAVANAIRSVFREADKILGRHAAHMSSYTDEITSLRAQLLRASESVQVLEKDRARLDWLDLMLVNRYNWRDVVLSWDHEDGTWVSTIKRGEYMGTLPVECSTRKHKDVREAVDAAMGRAALTQTASMHGAEETEG
jgi:hypothetical protein